MQVSRSGTVNDGVQANYSYDKGDNRTNVNVTVVGTSLPDLTINNVSATEGSALVFTVARGGSTESSVSVNYATSNGSATAGSDYTANSGTLTFASGETTRTISVSTSDDAISESAETVNMALSSATGGATISDPTGVGTINDNDVAAGPSFSVNDVTVTEGSILIFTVTKTGSTSNSFTLKYATANGTAIAGTNYTARSNTLIFSPTITSLTVIVPTTDDRIDLKGNKSFYLNLSNASSGSSIADPQGVGTIYDPGNSICTTCAQITTPPPPAGG